jgi:S1-C subfamily serine protease
MTSLRTDPPARSRNFFRVIVIALAAYGAWYLSTDVWRAVRVDAAPRPVVPRRELMPEEQAVIGLFEAAKGSVVFISTQERVVDYWTRNVMTVPRAPQDAPAPIPVGTSEDVQVGQKVFAIGNPFGLDWTLTTGIVSALDRSLTGEDERVIQHLIQTDAAINPGNSGGPLLDSAGRLIGMNTAIFSPSGASAGIGFAVPVDTINRVAPELIANGSYQPPSLGVDVDDVLSRAVARQLGVSGAAIFRVAPGGVGDRAGLRGVRRGARGSIVPGDVIVGIDGKAVDSGALLAARLDDYKPGDTVKLRVWREGKEIDVAAELQQGE